MRFKVFLGWFILSLSTNCLAEESKLTKIVPETKSWKEEMQSFKTTLEKLLPYAIDSDSFNAPENTLIIQSHIDKLKSGSKSLNHFKNKPESAKDPTVEFLSQSLENNIHNIQESIKKGRRDYARFLVLNTTSYCMECHTRNQSGPQFFSVNNDLKLGKIVNVEHVEYLISVREFQKAYDLILSLLSKDDALPYFGNEKLIRQGISLSVRYFADPDRALKIVESALKSKNLPYFFKQDLTNWKESLFSWKKEKAISKKLNSKIEFANNLITKAEALNTKTRSNRAGEVYLLRANALLLEAFKEPMENNQQSRVLFLIAESYRLLPEHLFWTLHEPYYEACLRKAAHTEQAKQCYDKLEESLILGYTGSSGLHLPTEIDARLRSLKIIAYP